VGVEGASHAVYISHPKEVAFIIQVFLKRAVVASRPGCNEEFTRKGTLWNTYPLEILD
jgi:hypothetical protein